ncbi:heme oxygenase-like isoform X1 [Thunnus maccoyii]|uniref:heme oxygenase-like isoform X1 n=2 Tax=Thunnus maccoyii TaxID=8240 RepID=UPI001C4CCB28|nr:heme oxygenase-like isoform X1 [Thunnus maccoyii]
MSARREETEEHIKERENCRHTKHCTGYPERKLRITGNTDQTTSLKLHPNWSTMETSKKTQTAAEQLTDKDLSEQIKKVTKDSHVRAENTELMLSFQRGQVSLPQYKLLLSSLYKIYEALEEEMDRNSNHPGVAPIYFPAELARLESIEKDLEYFYGKDWRDKIAVPTATKRYCHRLRQIGKESPELLIAHAYTRYLGDLSGGQVLGRIAQKSMGLKSNEGLSFFAFPGVSSPNLFKQLYRSRMNGVELTEEQRNAMLEEAVRAFELNIQVFDDLQKMLNVTENHLQNSSSLSKSATLQSNSSTMLRMVLGLFVALATVSMGIYIF